MFKKQPPAGSQQESKDESEKRGFPFERGKGRKGKRHGKRSSRR
jgi:hypothetical protein